MSDDKTHVESIVGPISDEGMTVGQRYLLGQHMMKNIVDAITAQVPDSSEYLLPRLLGHWAFFGEDNPEIRSATNMWAANAMQILLLPHERETYAQFRRNNKLPGFAGNRLPDHILPCANVWFETSFPAGKYPTLVPVRDKVEHPLVKIKRVAINAIHQWSAEPFPAHLEGQEGFLRNMSIIAFLEDATGTIHTFAGILSYGIGGALVWKVENIEELNNAIQGQQPRQNAGGPMSNLSQFVCAELAHVLMFHNLPPYAEFKASHESTPETEMTYDEQE